MAYSKNQKNITESFSCQSLNPQLYGKTITTNKNERFKLIGKIHFKFSVKEKETITIKQIKINGVSECQMNAGLYFRLTNKTKYFVLRWFDEVCFEYNELNEEAESKRLERD